MKIMATTQGKKSSAARIDDRCKVKHRKGQHQTPKISGTSRGREDLVLGIEERCRWVK